MPRTASNGIEIEYETLGDPAGGAGSAHHGTGRSVVRWPEAFVRRWFRPAITSSASTNRDVGLSSKMSGRAPILRAALRAAVGIPSDLPIRSTTWPRMLAVSSMPFRCRALTSSARRWAA